MTDRSSVEEAPVGEQQGNEAWFSRARRVMPGGVSSPTRAFRAVGGTPYFAEHGSGACIFDVEGRRYVDYVQSYGASILGHAHPAVLSVLEGALRKGTTFAAPTEGEVLLAEEVVARVPGCEMVRFVGSGGEATMAAVRLARGATGRSKVVKFDGCYHGSIDALLAGAGSGLATLGLPASKGVVPSSVADTIVVPYNVVPELDTDVACVIVEPVAANMGVVAPAADFLEGLRAACDTAGALLIFDEVVTGFRLGVSGASGAFGVLPDLWTFGKVLGGGLPIGAVGGPSELMSLLAPEGPVYQAGTLSGNPLATAAGLAVLKKLDDAAYERLHLTARRLSELLLEAAAQAGVAVQSPVVGPLVGIFFSADEVHDYEQAKAAGSGPFYARFFHEMLSRGVALAPGAYEALFPSLSHGEMELEVTARAARDAFAAVAAMASS